MQSVLKSSCTVESEAALTSITATLGAAIPRWDERVLFQRTGELGAGPGMAGHTPFRANTHRTGRETPLAVLLWEANKQRKKINYMEK